MINSTHIRAVLAILAASLILVSCENSDLIPVRVELGTRSVSKLPFVIAIDQGLFEKYGLDVDVKMPAPKFEGGIRRAPRSLSTKLSNFLKSDAEKWRPDIFVDGLTPNIVKRIDRARYPHRVAIAGTDCIVRAHIIGSKGISSAEELKGKRLGISARRDTTLGFAGLMFAERMGWDATQDISLKLNGRDIDALREGLVDGIVANEIRSALAMQEGFPVLDDTQTWGIAVAGNSVMVAKGWLDDATNRDIASRFLKATVEALALFHQDRDLALAVLSKWNGISDEEIAARVYERGQWMSKKPYPCYEGIKNTFETYDSNEMRKFEPSDFYDDRLIRELDESAFIDALY